jgi:LDH2 family malate/lactate/ureidoglycolate dehydrogenase
MMTTATPAALIAFAARVLETIGTPTEAAHRVADGLVGSDACGVRTHGMRVLPRYVDAVERGELDPKGQPTVASDSPTYALVEGRWTFGHVAASAATELVIAKATQLGVAMVGLVQSHHIGRLGEYAEMAARAGVILTVWGGGQGAEQPCAAPFGGRRAVLHTNPIAISVPGEPGHPMLLDIATTGVAGSKVDIARAKGESLEPGLLLDRDGAPTTDPRWYFEGGALLPFGGHKGYGFMLAAELLGRTFLGADDHVRDTGGGPVLRRSGTAFLGVRCDLFVPRPTFEQRAVALFDQIRAVEPQHGFDRVRVPGDLEFEAVNRTASDGITFDATTSAELEQLGYRLGVPFPGTD